MTKRSSSSQLLSAVREGIQLQTARFREALRETAENHKRLSETADQLEAKLYTLEHKMGSSGTVDAKYKQKLQRSKQQRQKVLALSRMRQQTDAALPSGLTRSRKGRPARKMALDAEDEGRIYQDKTAVRRVQNRQRVRNLFADNAAVVGGSGGDSSIESIQETSRSSPLWRAKRTRNCTPGFRY